MFLDPLSVSQQAALVLLAGAALWDARTGCIPNALTLPPLFLAPLVYLGIHGLDAALWSLVSALGCGLLPYLMFRKGAAGGGDVKLLAALGAVAGVGMGIETQLYGFGIAAAFSLVLLAFRGELLRTLGRSLVLLLSGLLPRSRKPVIATSELTSVRMGVPFFAGALLSLYLGQLGV